jgi:hypothetical protein
MLTFSIMKNYFNYTLLFLLACHYVNGQTSTPCDSIYKYPDTEAVYKGGAKDILDYVSKNIMPMINDCYKSETKPLSYLKIHLTIDQSGKVTQAYLLNTEVPGTCRKQVQNELIKMEGWTSAKNAGKTVCSIRYVPVNCKAAVPDKP